MQKVQWLILSEEEGHNLARFEIYYLIRGGGDKLLIRGRSKYNLLSEGRIGGGNLITLSK